MMNHLEDSEPNFYEEYFLVIIHLSSNRTLYYSQFFIKSIN
jgi:hypothetical protein